MPPPTPSLHQAKTIPKQIPNGKNKNPSQSIKFAGLFPSPTIKSNTNPMLAILQILAIQRISRVNKPCISVWFFIVLSLNLSGQTDGRSACPAVFAFFASRCFISGCRGSAWLGGKYYWLCICIFSFGIKPDLPATNFANCVD